MRTDWRAAATFRGRYTSDTGGPGAATSALRNPGSAPAQPREAGEWWSDRAGSRMRPMRALTAAITVVVAVLAVSSQAGSWAAVVALAAAAILTVSPNGLAFTAVAEHAGPGWAGRAMGIQNTVQNAVGTATPPVMAAVVGVGGYGAAFGAAAVMPLIAAAVIPVEGRRAKVRGAAAVVPNAKAAAAR